MHETQLEQAAEIYEDLSKSPAYQRVAVAHATICNQLLCTYMDAGFTEEQAFKLMHDQVSQMKVNL